jgi:hypothetical protein
MAGGPSNMHTSEEDVDLYGKSYCCPMRVSPEPGIDSFGIELLGVDRTASQDQIKKAYRKVSALSFFPLPVPGFRC